jgi:hypothetical protein
MRDMLSSAGRSFDCRFQAKLGLGLAVVPHQWVNNPPHMLRSDWRS